MPFTVDGSDTLEKRIAKDLGRIRDEALKVVGREHLTALALGGGYGRGEGGVYEIDGEERVYNDYDIFVVVPFKSRARRRWVSERLREVKQRLEPECGIHVDFSPPMPVATLPRQPHELMFMEARAGYHVLYGPEDVLDALPAHDMARPPLEECARLFMNRGVGLLMAQMVLREGRPLVQADREFIIRNMYKAHLAMGDSVLFLEGRYSSSYVERRKRFEESSLEGISDPVRLRALYEGAMAFKFRPRHTVPEGKTLAGWLAETVREYLPVFLWFERQRLQRPELTWEGYRALPSRLPQLSGTGCARNVVRNFRCRSAGLPPPGEWLLHPRDRILRRVPALLMANVSRPADEAIVLKLWEHFG